MLDLKNVFSQENTSATGCEYTFFFLIQAKLKFFCMVFMY